MIDFVDRHPGGREIFLLAATRDGTDLFDSYLPFSSTPPSILTKYRICSLEGFRHPIYEPDSGFYRHACSAVVDYFHNTGLDSKDGMTDLRRMLPVYVLFFCVQ